MLRSYAVGGLDSVNSTDRGGFRSRVDRCTLDGRKPLRGAVDAEIEVLWCYGGWALLPEGGFFEFRDYGGVISADGYSYIGVRVLVYMNVMRVNKAMR